MKPVRLKTPNTKHIELFFKISSSKINLIDYEDSTFAKSKQLWQQLKDALLLMLPKATVTLGEWKIGSIIIKVFIWKEDGSDWTNEEIGDVHLLTLEFSKIVENLLPLTECICKVDNPDFQEHEITQDESVTSTIDRSSAIATFNIKASTKEERQRLGNIDSKVLMAHCQSVLSSNEDYSIVPDSVWIQSK